MRPQMPRKFRCPGAGRALTCSRDIGSRRSNPHAIPGRDGTGCTVTQELHVRVASVYHNSLLPPSAEPLSLQSGDRLAGQACRRSRRRRMLRRPGSLTTSLCYDSGSNGEGEGEGGSEPMALAYICVGGGESSLDSGGAEEEGRGECMRPARSAG